MFDVPYVRRASHPRELPLDGGHLRLAVADLLLMLEVIKAPLPVVALAVRDFTGALHVEVVFCLALEHGVMVLHPALVALDGCCHMLGALIVDCDAVALAELLGRIVGQRYGHGQFEDRGQGIGAVEAQEIGQPFLEIGQELGVELAELQRIGHKCCLTILHGLSGVRGVRCLLRLNRPGFTITPGIMLSAAIRARSAFVRRRRPLGPSITSCREIPTPFEPSKWTPILPSISKIHTLRHAHAHRMAESSKIWQEGIGIALTQNITAGWGKPR